MRCTAQWGIRRTPLYYLGFSGVLNIILNLFFVIVCHMDVAGVALASIISQYVSAALILQALLHCKDIYALHPGKLRLESGTYEGYPEAGNALRIAERNFPVCLRQQLCADGCEFL